MAREMLLHAEEQLAALAFLWFLRRLIARWLRRLREITLAAIFVERHGGRKNFLAFGF
jgi:hypothetical protein